jgi:hypothetical protein
VDTNRRTAPGTGPPQFLLLDKVPHAVGFYTPQILNHAHPVIRAIPLIQVTELLARKARTAGAKLPASLPAISNPAADPRLGLAAVVDPATGAWIPAPHEGAAEPAIHPTWGDKARLVQTSGCEFLCHRSGLNCLPR